MIKRERASEEIERRTTGKDQSCIQPFGVTGLENVTEG